MNITILGAGYVGLTTAALFSQINGIKVYLIEPNPKKLEVIKTGKSFFFEAGINPLIKNGLEKKSLIPTNSYEDSIPNSQIVFSCVGTPDNPDGSSNLSYAFSALEETIKNYDSGRNQLVYVQKSTVPVGTGQKMKQIITKNNSNITYVSNPEFLRESTAVFDTLFFDRVVVGGEDQKALDAVLSIYKQLEENRESIAKLAEIPTNETEGQYIKTNLNSAELIKVTANAFLALKISFANSIAVLADKTDADITEVMDAVGADKRIGRAFLNAGRGYGGGCFPKDVSGLISSALENNVDLEIMQAAQSVNASMAGYVVKKVKTMLEEDLKEKNVTVLGLSFKAGTSDVRKSPGVAIANLLQKHGAKVLAYDPEANEEAKEDLNPNITICEKITDTLKNSDAVVITTDWEVFADQETKDLLKDQVVIDAVNMYKNPEFKKYTGIGRH